MTRSSPSAREGAPRKRSILLVEDDDAVRRSLQLLLTARGHRVRAYASAVGLADDPEALRCDCLIADLMMPPTDAIALLADLRSAEWSGYAILISGFLDEAWQGRATAAGFHRIFVKPLSEMVLVRTLEQLSG
jgi:FixJ family two-component response regulator